jgi:uncharacterized membrane protein YeaQ/YmgE (transglycosylase-associated protein family)
MVRIILGVIAGFIAWSIVWVGSDQMLITLSREWYGSHQFAFENAMFNETAFTPDNTILLLHLVRAVIISLMAGFLAAFIANENRKAPFALGLLLLLFGLMVQVMAWRYLPVWYHAIFLALLVPVTVAGGRMRSSVNVR